MIYKLIFNLVFRHLDAERAHHIGIFAIRILGASGLSRFLNVGSNKPLVVMGLHFNGPFGIAAGFDKNAVAIKALGDLGFSHVEVGTVTAVAQDGNEKPRLFRLLADRALINRMGFNNKGAAAVAKNIARTREKYGNSLPIIGINIGKSRVVEVENAVSDYQASAKILSPLADYIAVNVSSPNTPGLRSLQSVEALEPILRAVQAEALDKPVLVKIAPDLADEDIVAVAKLAKKLKLAGVIATNTTISRAGLKSDSKLVESQGAGGLSGAPLKQRSREVLVLLRKNLPEEMTVISVGGVETAAEVRERIALGANLVQGYSGFIYEGPLWARRIKKQL